MGLGYADSPLSPQYQMQKPGEGNPNLGHANLGHANLGHANLGHANLGHGRLPLQAAPEEPFQPPTDVLPWPIARFARIVQFSGAPL